MSAADPPLRLLGRLVGTWTTEATHPMVPGVVVHGTTTFEWLHGERFLIVRSDTDHPDFPGAISLIGYMGADRIDEASADTPKHERDELLRMHYFDTHGVFRANDVEIDETAWRMSTTSNARTTPTAPHDARSIDRPASAPSRSPPYPPRRAAA